MATIYLIRNRATQKCYVGKTTQTVRTRWKQHLAHAKNGLKTSLANAIRKYGSEQFTVNVLADSIIREAELNRLEKDFIALFQSNNRRSGYNLTAGGEGLWNPNEHIRQKMSKARIGTTWSAETRRKMAGRIPWNKGGTASKEQRRKMSEVKVGKPISEEQKRRLLIANTGRVCTEETRRKISEAQKGKPRPYAAVPCSEEKRRKISVAHKGRVRSEEARRNMSKGQKAAWARRRQEVLPWR